MAFGLQCSEIRHEDLMLEVWHPKAQGKLNIFGVKEELLTILWGFAAKHVGASWRGPQKANMHWQHLRHIGHLLHAIFWRSRGEASPSLDSFLLRALNPS